MGLPQAEQNFWVLGINAPQLPQATEPSGITGSCLGIRLPQELQNWAPINTLPPQLGHLITPFMASNCALHSSMRFLAALIWSTQACIR